MNGCRLRTAIGNGNSDKDVVLRSFRVFDEHIEVTIFVKHASVQELKFRGAETATTVFLDQLCVGKLRLWILVERLHVGMRRRGVEIVIKLLHILTVITLR